MLPIASVAGEKKTPMIAAGAASALTGSECTPYTFNYSCSAKMFAYGAGPFVTNNLGKKVYHLTHNYVAGKNFRDFAKQTIANNGGETVGNSLIDFGQQDMSNEISEALNSDADVVWAHIFASDLARLYNQMNQFGLQDQMEVFQTANDIFYTHGADPSAVAGTYSAVNW
jgi:branched-chain amino acid transport system substrate-binding protein